MTLKVGDTLYRFDGNRRVYPKNQKGFGARAIYSEHFEPYKITGETTQSWICGTGYAIAKVNKKTLYESGGKYGGYQWYTFAKMHEDIWDKEHRHRIVDKVQLCTVEELRQIGKLLEYTYTLKEERDA